MSNSRAGGSGFATQVKATIRRQLLQKRRLWLSTLLELVLPILFALGLYSISLRSTRKEFPARNYVDESTPLPLGDYLKVVLCYNKTTAGNGSTPNTGRRNDSAPFSSDQTPQPTFTYSSTSPPIPAVTADLQSLLLPCEIIDIPNTTIEVPQGGGGGLSTDLPYDPAASPFENAVKDWLKEVSKDSDLNTNLNISLGGSGGNIFNKTIIDIPAFKTSATCFAETRDTPTGDLCMYGVEKNWPSLLALALVTNEMDIVVPTYDEYVLYKWVACSALKPPASLAVDKFAKARQPGRVFLTPHNGRIAKAFAEYMNSTFALFKHSFGGFFQSREEAIKYTMRPDTEGDVWAVISFDDDDVEEKGATVDQQRKSGKAAKKARAKGLSYTLSMNTTAQPYLSTPSSVLERFAFGLGSKEYATSTASGALTLQKSVNDFYLSNVLVMNSDGDVGGDAEDDGSGGVADADGFDFDVPSVPPIPSIALPTIVLPTTPAPTPPPAAGLPPPRIVIAPMPTAAYSQDDFLQIGGKMGPLMLVLAYLYPVSQLSKRLVEEKEKRLREGTMIMGLGRAAFFFSWLFIYHVQMFFVSIGIALVLRLAITPQTNFFIIWAAYLLFSVATVNMAAVLATFFNKAKIAALCVPLIFFSCSLPSFAIPRTVGGGAMVFHILSTLCPVPFAFALELIFSYELKHGLGWASISSSSDIPFSFLTCIVWLVIDAVAYIGLLLYFDSVLPKEWGTTRHPLFCLIENPFFSNFKNRKKTAAPTVESNVYGSSNTNGNDIPLGVIATTASLNTAASPPIGATSEAAETKTATASPLVPPTPSRFNSANNRQSAALASLSSKSAAIVDASVIKRQRNQQQQQLRQQSVCSFSSVAEALRESSSPALVRGGSTSNNNFAALADALSMSNRNNTNSSFVFRFEAPPALPTLASAAAASSAVCPRESANNPKYYQTKINPFSALEDYPRPFAEATVHVAKLRKEFGAEGSSRKHVAVDDMELALFPDSITVLLGHNGAGKTTVMNMMTGMMSPTSGDVTIYGNSILTNMQAIRRDIGFCPQHNILWDDLTCLEHLQYFARLKGFSGPEVDEEAMELLRKVDLVDKRDVFSCNLSGGQKRKLSVAIAFMGRARLVLLDEPTAGMDVAARRHTWDVLKEMAKGRTILLTTHFMDEADLLGHRIAIMSKGSLHSYGSPTFLKNNLGSGYVIKIGSLGFVSDPAPFLEVVRHAVPSATIRSAKGQELDIAIPKADVRSLPAALRVLEGDAEVREVLGIATVSVSVASLEDAFLAIAHHEEVLAHNRHGDASETPSLLTPAAASDVGGGEGEVASDVQKAFEILERVYGGAAAAGEQSSEADTVAIAMAEHAAGCLSGFFSQLRGMLMKRLRHGRRDKQAIALQIVAPLLCIFIAVSLASVPLADPPRTAYDNTAYGSLSTSMAVSGCDDFFADDAVWDSDFASIQHIDASSFVGTASTPIAVGHNMSQHLLSHFVPNRMVAFACKGWTNGGGGSSSGNVSTAAPLLPPQDIMMIVNATSKVSAPQAMAQLYRARGRREVLVNRQQKKGSNADDDDDGFDDVGVFVSQWPFPQTKRQKGAQDIMAAVLTSIFVLIPFSLIPSTFAAFVVRERECKSKHLQFVSGANYFAYWAANFIFDLSAFLITIVATLVIFWLYDQSWAFGSFESFVGVSTLLLLFATSSIGFAYVASFAFDSHSTAQVVIMVLNFVFGFVFLILMFFFRNMSETKAVAEKMVLVLRALPPFALGDGLMMTVLKNTIAPFTGDEPPSPFDWDVGGCSMAYMGVLSLVFAAVTLVVDHPAIGGQLIGLFARAKRAMMMRGGRHQRVGRSTPSPTAVGGGWDEDAEDEDVARERLEIESGLRSSDVVQIKGLRREFNNGKKIAVQSITLGVKKGEVFGFLGTNGAGKTTTMSILTTEITPTAGSGTICGHDIVSEASTTRSLIGYCPQFDAILDLLTPREHLELFATLRGSGGRASSSVAQKNQRAEIVDALLMCCALDKFRDVPAGSLSGGNKRKLSVAMALVGCPSIVFLDEPSAGMDPHARRQLWDVVIFVAKHSSVVLTTHHLEEVDVLAHRVGIMDAGLLKCLGTLEHLKHKFGSGFELTLQVEEGGGGGGSPLLSVSSKDKKSSFDGVTAAESSSLATARFMSKTYPDAVLVEARQQRMLYCLPFASTDLASLFEAMQKAADGRRVGIVDYTIQQTSLEQVFMRISERGRRAADHHDQQHQHDSRTECVDAAISVVCDGARKPLEMEMSPRHVVSDEDSLPVSPRIPPI